MIFSRNLSTSFSTSARYLSWVINFGNLAVNLKLSGRMEWSFSGRITPSRAADVVFQAVSI
jgi:hypothetical protein